MSDLLICVLTRDEGPAQSRDGTFGTLVVPVPGAMVLQTMEDDWLNNRLGVSCIPPGTYPLVRSWFYKHNYEVFEVTKVPNRRRILIHPGNTEEDVEGCIAPGSRRGMLRVHDEDIACTFAAGGMKDSCPMASHWVTKRAVLNSRMAFVQFMGWLAHVEQAILQVQWAPGLP
jgi:hypothetical protein